MSGLKKTTTFGDIYEVRGFDVWDIADKKKILINQPAAKVQAFFGMAPGLAHAYARRKDRRTLNGKKYAIRFASTK